MNNPRLNKIAELKRELSNTHAPFLSSEDHEDVSDRYQEALEIGYYKDELRDQIKALEKMSDQEYADSIEEIKPEDLYEPRCRFGESDGHGGIDEEEYDY